RLQAASTMCSIATLLLRECTRRRIRRRIRRQQKDAEHDPGREQAIFTKRLQDKSLDTDQQSRDDQTGSREIKNQTQWISSRMFRVFENREDRQAEDRDIERQTKP